MFISHVPFPFLSYVHCLQAILSGIWDGKISNSEVSCYSFGDKDGGSNNDISGDKLYMFSFPQNFLLPLF